jgi:hypothetical protein
VSEKPLADRLLIKPGDTVWVSDAERVAVLGPLPDGVTTVAGGSVAAAAPRVAVVFVEDAATARRRFGADAAALRSVPVLWVLYPKGGRADINRDSLWPLIAEHGLRPITNVSAGDTWSALRFRELKPGEAPFTGGR